MKNRLFIRPIFCEKSQRRIQLRAPLLFDPLQVRNYDFKNFLLHFIHDIIVTLKGENTTKYEKSRRRYENFMIAFNQRGKDERVT